MMTMNDFPRPALLLACLILASPWSKADPAQDAARNIENAQRDAETTQRALAKLPPACTVGAAVHAKGKWLVAPKAAPEQGRPYTMVQQFESATMTGAVRAALNRAAVRVLDKVETRDAQGKWLDAGPVNIHEAPGGCDYVWLQQDLGGQRQVEALRYTFRRSDEPVTLANGAVFQSY
jgi:hypothetical protein